jgi:Zn-dependent M28 family amino/carboxypeptidase
MSDDVEQPGGLTLQGIDDNAVGVGVLLELAERLKRTCPLAMAFALSPPAVKKAISRKTC